MSAGGENICTIAIVWQGEKWYNNHKEVMIPPKLPFPPPALPETGKYGDIMPFCLGFMA